MTRVRCRLAVPGLAVLVSLPQALVMIPAGDCHALPTPVYLPVYGGPTYSPDAGGYIEPSITNQSVNNAGTAVGTAAKRDGSGIDLRVRAVRWDGSGAAATELGDLGTVPSGYSYSLAINDAGTAVGYAEKYDGSGNGVGNRAVRWDAAGTAATELGGLGANPAELTYSSAAAINNAGTAVGSAEKYDGSGNNLGGRAARWDAAGTAATELGNLGTDLNDYTVGNFAKAINDAGTAVGYCEKYDSAGNPLGDRAVRWDAAGTAATELGNLGTDPFGVSFGGSANAINSAGTAVGVVTKFNEFGEYLGNRAVRWDAGGTAATELGNLGTNQEGGTMIVVLAINDAGTAVGYADKYDGSGNYQGSPAVRWDGTGTAATELGNLGTDPNGATYGYALAINAAGTIVGAQNKWDDLGIYVDTYAVYWGADGVAVDLNTLIDPNSGWLLHSAEAISDTGWIAGIGVFDPDGPGGQDSYERLFLIHVPATAVPEPATVVLLVLAALGLVSTFGRRQRVCRSIAGGVIMVSVLLSAAGSAWAGMYSAANVSELIAAINAANQNAEPDSIALAAGATFALTDVNNSTNGPTGLPTIAAIEQLTIFGNGSIIERSTAAGTPSFRLFDVAAGASLALENLTLQGGRARGKGVSAQGGAILNQGTLALQNAIVQNNTAEGWSGPCPFGCPPLLAELGAGGGIFSSDSLTVEGGAIRNNQAVGDNGHTSISVRGGGTSASTSGGAAFGGGLYVAGGIADLEDVSFVENVVQGGKGGNGHATHGPYGGKSGGGGYGGGLYVANGTVNLTDVTLSSNSVWGGAGGNGGNGVSSGDAGNGGDAFGGALRFADGTVTLRNSIVTDNAAQGGAAGVKGPASGSMNGTPGLGQGGGLYINVAQVGLDEFTMANVTGNSASTNFPNIFGPYDLIPNSNLLPGDYNGDGTVNAADYAVYRDRKAGIGGTTLINEGATPGLVTIEDYTFWKAHYGDTINIGSSLVDGSTNVPEPATLALAFLSLVGLLVDRRRESLRSYA